MVAGIRLPALLSGRWSAAAARVLRFATRDWFSVIGPVRARETLGDGVVLERIELTVTGDRIAEREQKGRRPPPMYSCRLIHDRAVDFQVDAIAVEVEGCEPVLPALQPVPELVGGEEGQTLLERARTVHPELAEILVQSIRVRRAVLREGDTVEVRGQRGEVIDPRVADRHYRDLPLRVVVRAPSLLFAGVRAQEDMY